MPSCQPSKPIAILVDNLTNCLDLLSNNNKEGISPGISNHGEKGFWPADNDNEDIRLANIDQQTPTTPNWIPQNGLLSESSWNLREVTFSKSKFLVGTPVSDTRYEYPGSQNNNPFYPFNDQLDYALADYFAESETIKIDT